MWDGHIGFIGTVNQIWKERNLDFKITEKIDKFQKGYNSQSKCFFLGPIISSVVALQTDLAKPWPERLWRAANSLSLIVCPAIISLS